MSVQLLIRRANNALDYWDPMTDDPKVLLDLIRELRDALIIEGETS